MPSRSSGDAARAPLSSPGVTLSASVAKATYRPSPEIEGVEIVRLADECEGMAAEKQVPGSTE
jgi:hypothetical protein